MPITLLTGPANSGKARVVLEAVRRDLDRGAEPLLIVPTREDVERYRRELAATGAALGVGVGRFDDLLDEVVARAGSRGELLGEHARARALEAIAARRSPEGLHAAYAEALGAFITELGERRVSAARLGRAVRAAGLADHALRAAEEVEEYESLLARIRRVDAGRRAPAALDGLRRSPWLWEARPIHLYGFDDLTRLQLDAIETLGTVVDADVTVSLSFEPGRAAFASRARAFEELAPIAREHRTHAGRAEHYAAPSRAALSHVERSLFETGAKRARECEGVRLLEAADEREELELIASEVSGLLREGVPAEEIAVGVRSREGVADLFEEVFARARIPFALERERRFADTATGSALVGLLRCAGGADGEVADLLAWLRTPGLLKRPELADRLEARARREGIRGAREARVLWESENWPIDALERLDGAGSEPRALISRALDELERAFAFARSGSAGVLVIEELDEARALTTGRAALEELRELARLAPELAPGSCEELAVTLGALRFRGGASAPARAEHRPGVVTVADPLTLRARRVRFLFLCRMQAGSFPSLERHSPVLGEEERRALAERGGVRLSDARDALADERYLLYAAASRPEEALVLSWHRSAEDGTPRTRSQFVDEICELFDGAPATLEAPPPPYASVDAGRAPSSVDPAPNGAGASTADASPALHAVEQLEDLGRISAAELLPDAEEHVWSASSLGTWMSCPMRWFVERVLRAEDLDPRGEPLARGLLAHVALKDTLEALERETGSARVTPATLESAHGHLAAALSAHADEVPLSAEGERAPALRMRLHTDLERYLEHAAETAGSSESTALEPRHLELEFGLDGDALPALDLGGGVKLRGRIDRVDVSSEGEAVVYDYKGRSASPAAKWLETGEVQVALYMRAVEELLGLRAAGGFYQPLSGDLRARGLLDGDSGLSLPIVASDRRDAGETRELIEGAVALACEAAGEAARGELERRPRTCTPRGGCAYPEICRCGR